MKVNDASMRAVPGRLDDSPV
jgi:copper chaperone CopZ